MTSDASPGAVNRVRQGDSSSRRPLGGLGRGLAIVKHLVELHGGSVRAEEPRGGAGRDLHDRAPDRLLTRGQKMAGPEAARPIIEAASHD